MYEFIQHQYVSRIQSVQILQIDHFDQIEYVSPEIDVETIVLFDMFIMDVVIILVEFLELYLGIHLLQSHSIQNVFADLERQFEDHEEFQRNVVIYILAIFPKEAIDQMDILEYYFILLNELIKVLLIVFEYFEFNIKVFLLDFEGDVHINIGD